MHILLTTYGLLLIFALYCSAQWRSAIDMAFMDAVAIERFALFRQEALASVNNDSRNLYKKYTDKKTPKPTSKAVSSNVNSTEAASDSALLTDDDEEEEDAPIERPDAPEEDTPKTKVPTSKCTQHLHIGDLFKGENPTITEGKGKACFTLLKNLMTVMYGEQEFYEEAKELIPDFEEQFLTNLFERTKEEQTDKQWISKVGHLGSVELDDELQSYIRYKIFTGNKSRLVKGSEDDPGYFPLVQFTSMNKNKSLMSIWLAPKTLLMALFQDPEIVKEVIAVRREMHKEVKKDHSPQAKAAKEKDLRLRFGVLIPDQSLVQYIDFQVSTTVPPDSTKVKKPKQRRKKQLALHQLNRMD